MGEKRSIVDRTLDCVEGYFASCFLATSSIFGIVASLYFIDENEEKLRDLRMQENSQLYDKPKDNS